VDGDSGESARKDDATCTAEEEVSDAAFHSTRELMITRSRDPGNHEFTTCQWNALLSDGTINRQRGINSF